MYFLQNIECYFSFFFSVFFPFSVGILTFCTHSKRISGFDMAPPSSAMLPGAAIAAGIYILTDFRIANSLNCYLVFFVCLLWYSVESSTKLHGVILVR